MPRWVALDALAGRCLGLAFERSVGRSGSRRGVAHERDATSSVHETGSNRADSAAVPTRTVRCTRRTDRSSKRPPLTLSFHTPGRTSTFEPPLATATPGPATTPNRPSPKRERCSNPHAGSVLWTRQYISSWWQLAVHMFPTVRFRNDVDDQRPGAIHPPGPETKVYRRVYQQVSPGCLLAVHRYTYGDTPRNSPPALSRCPGRTRTCGLPLRRL
jgi:hypothetical protein